MEPSLARDTKSSETLSKRIRSSLRVPRRLTITRQGKLFIIMTVMVGFGAINTGNNLLYLLLGMMIGLIIMSGILAEISLRGLKVTRLPAESLFAETACRPRYRLANHKRLLPSFSIEVREVEEIKRNRQGQPSSTLKRSATRPRCWFHQLAPRSARTESGLFTPSRRGLHHFEAIELATRFPFGFFEKSLRQSAATSLLVYPRIVETARLPYPATRQQGSIPQTSAGQGLEFFALSDYQEGQDFRAIHFKVSAKRNQLIAREFEREQVKDIQLLLYSVLLEPQDASPLALEIAERTIEVTAALARLYLAEGWVVSLATPLGVISPGNGAGQLQRIYSALALHTISHSSEPLPIPGRSAHLPAILVVPNSDRPALPAGLSCDRRLEVSHLGEVAILS